ncbi:hypothetical protein GCM10022384_00440 [Streptomyces marokkonensis]|uniref:Uncharacterized protein n=1 Tax=Streptomyces marokkonensis TaxID=324855 RepID=A0ABP7NPM9_9ACTN
MGVLRTSLPRAADTRRPVIGAALPPGARRALVHIGNPRRDPLCEGEPRPSAHDRAVGSAGNGSAGPDNDSRLAADWTSGG